MRNIQQLELRRFDYLRIGEEEFGNDWKFGGGIMVEFVEIKSIESIRQGIDFIKQVIQFSFEHTRFRELLSYPDGAI